MTTTGFKHNATGRSNGKRSGTHYRRRRLPGSSVLIAQPCGRFSDPVKFRGYGSGAMFAFLLHTWKSFWGQHRETLPNRKQICPRLALTGGGASKHPPAAGILKEISNRAKIKMIRFEEKLPDDQLNNKQQDGPSENEQQDEPLTITVPQAGKLVGVGRSAAYAAAHRGELPVVRIGRLLRVPKAALNEMLQWSVKNGTMK